MRDGEVYDKIWWLKAYSECVTSHEGEKDMRCYKIQSSATLHDIQSSWSISLYFNNIHNDKLLIFSGEILL